MQLISGFQMMLSLHFGMFFWLDDDDDFCYCPAFKDGTADLDKLFTIHRHLVIDKVTEYEREKV